MAKRVIKVRYIKNDKFAYECADTAVTCNSFVWCKLNDSITGKEYEQLAIVTDVCDEAEAEVIIKQLAAKNKILKTARKFTNKGSGVE